MNQCITASTHPTFHNVGAHRRSCKGHNVGIEWGGATEDGFDSAAEKFVDLLEGQLVPHGIVAENAGVNLFFLFAKCQIEEELFDGRFFGSSLPEYQMCKGSLLWVL